MKRPSQVPLGCTLSFIEKLVQSTRKPLLSRQDLAITTFTAGHHCCVPPVSLHPVASLTSACFGWIVLRLSFPSPPVFLVAVVMGCGLCQSAEIETIHASGRSSYQLLASLVTKLTQATAEFRPGRAALLVC